MIKIFTGLPQREASKGKGIRKISFFIFYLKKDRKTYRSETLVRSGTHAYLSGFEISH